MSLALTPVPGDAAQALASLHRACFPEDSWDAAAMAEILGLAGFFGRLAWQGDAAAGFALALDLGGECEILSLATLPRYRRTGVARALLRGICRDALDRRAECAVLEVAIDNSAARALYAACGFTAIGSRPNYYRRGENLVDAVVLRLSLDGAALFA